MLQPSRHNALVATIRYVFYSDDSYKTHATNVNTSKQGYQTRNQNANSYVMHTH